MSGAKKLKVLGGTLIVLFLLNSCAEFFSTSWGEAFKRDPKSVKVNASNVNALLDAAKGDTELSRAILDQINADSSDKLKHAAIKAANQASGVATLALENVQTLIDAVDKGGDQKALEKVAKEILGAAEKNDLLGISDQLVKILGNEVKVASNDSKTALISAGEIAVFVPKTGGGSEAAVVSINVGSNGKGTATITVGGNVTTYDCEVIDNETITLKTPGPGGGEKVTDIKYDVKDDNTLVLSDLDNIPAIEDAGYATKSNPSVEEVPPGKPEFEESFIKDVAESDLTLMVMTLILAKIEKEEENGGSLESYMNSWTAPEKGKEKDVNTGKNLDAEEKVVAAIVNGMVSRGEDTSELTDMVKELLGVDK
jgi:hypothetical protein